VFTVMVILGATLAIDTVALQLVADIRLALKRADLSLDEVSYATGVPIQRLSDQLNGKTPCTCLWRLLVAPEMRVTLFRLEFLTIQAERIDRAVVGVDLSRLLAGVEQLTSSLRNRDEEAA
jgi:hypothetical protein